MFVCSFKTKCGRAKNLCHRWHVRATSWYLRGVCVFRRCARDAGLVLQGRNRNGANKQLNIQTDWRTQGPTVRQSFSNCHALWIHHHAQQFRLIIHNQISHKMMLFEDDAVIRLLLPCGSVSLTVDSFKCNVPRFVSKGNQTRHLSQ